MAFLDDPTNQEEEEQGGEQALAPSTGGATVGGGAGSQSAGPRRTRTGSGSFTNLRDYLSANRQRISGLSGKVAGQTEKEAQKIRGGISEAREKYTGAGSQVAQEFQRYGGEAGTGSLREQISGTVSRAGKSGVEGPDFTSEQFQQYSRPGEFKAQDIDLSKQRQEAQEFQQRAGALGQGTGRFQALKRAVGPSQYSAGQSRLDAMLLARDTGAREQLSAAREQALQGTGAQEFQDIQSQYEKQLGDVQQRRGDISQFAQEQLTGAGQEFEAGLSERASAKQAEQEALRQRFEESIGARSVTDEQGNIIDPDYAMSQADMDALGLTAGMKLYNPNVAAQMAGTFRMDQPTISSMATQEDVARAQALAGLSGDTSGLYDLDPTAAGVFDPSKMGTYQDPRLQGLEDVTSAAQTQYETGVRDPWVQQQEQKIAAEKAAFAPMGLDPASSYRWLEAAKGHTGEVTKNDLLKLALSKGIHLSEAKRLYEIGKLDTARTSGGGLKSYFESQVQGRGPTLGVE